MRRPRGSGYSLKSTLGPYPADLFPDPQEREVPPYLDAFGLALKAHNGRECARFLCSVRGLADFLFRP
jgi:hypothetical protein